MDAAAKQKPIEEYDDFPGSRVLGMSFKKAVERFIRAKYGDRVGNGLSIDEIRYDFPALRKAIGIYNGQFGFYPLKLRYLSKDDREGLARVREKKPKRQKQLRCAELDDFAFAAMRSFAQSRNESPQIPAMRRTHHHKIARKTADCP